MNRTSAGTGARPLPHRRAAGRSATLLLTLVCPLLALLAPAPASAQDNITELAVIRGGNSGIQPPLGFTRIDVDLNQGAYGDYIYLCYKRGVGAPITGLAVTLNDGVPPSQAGFVRIDVDLNDGAGGAYVYLWHTKDPGCAAVREIIVESFGEPPTTPPPPGFTRIGVDLNENAGGRYLYFAYRMF